MNESRATARVVIPRSLQQDLHAHLFPGDRQEHGAVLLAGYAFLYGRHYLYVRDVVLARDGIDHVAGTRGHGALTPDFIQPLILRAGEERLVYIAVHNHLSRKSVGFSEPDFAGHERGFPALLSLAMGMPVAGMVFGSDSAQVDLWLPNGAGRASLDCLKVVGGNVHHVYPQPLKRLGDESSRFDRQVRMFGEHGQAVLRAARIGVVGAGGVGSMLVEYLAHLGVGTIVVSDFDFLDESNCSRVVGSRASDLLTKPKKIELMRRLVSEIHPDTSLEAIDGDFAVATVAARFLDCDYIFLAADSMRARLVFNAVVNQYMVPGCQAGTRVQLNEDGHLTSIFGVARLLIPGSGCMICNELIDNKLLAEEAVSDAERRDHRYGAEDPNPSVITLNAVCASYAINEFLLRFLEIRPEEGDPPYFQFDHLAASIHQVLPRKDVNCTECGAGRTSRLGRGSAERLPTFSFNSTKVVSPESDKPSIYEG